MAATTMYATPSGAGSKNGSDWDNAFDTSALVSDMYSNSEAGDLYYLAPGTYTLTGNLAIANTRDGTGTAPIRIIGTTAVGSTVEATGSSRAVIAIGNYNLIIAGDHWQSFGIVFSGTKTDSYAIQIGPYTVLRNCKASNSGAGASTQAIQTNGYYAALIDCEVTCPAGTGVSAGNYAPTLLGCYVHDSVTGFSNTGGNAVLVGCVFDTCSTVGVGLANSYRVVIHACDFYGNGIGIRGGTAATCVWATSCNFVANTTGLSWSTATPANVLEWCNFYGNTADVSNVTKGATCTAIDPSYADAANGDFRVGAALIGAGFPSVMPGTSFSAPAVPGALHIVAPVLPAAGDVRKNVQFGYRSALSGDMLAGGGTRPAGLSGGLA